MDINGKRVLITGGGRGIGYELAKACVAQGAAVLICGRDQETLTAAQEKLGNNAKTTQIDLAQTDAADQLAERVSNQLGGLDILINNAAIQYNYSFFDRDYQDVASDVTTELTINMLAPIKLCAALLPSLQQSPSAAIVNIGSGLALAPKRSAAIYCASKAGLRNFTRALHYQAQQKAPHIHVADVKFFTSTRTQLGIPDGQKRLASYSKRC